jgi:hypothetical protein
MSQVLANRRQVGRPPSVVTRRRGERLRNPVPAGGISQRPRLCVVEALGTKQLYDI